MFNKEQRFLRWNSVANRLLGYTDEEIKKMTALDFIYEEDRQLFMGDMQKVIANGSNQQVLRIKKKDGYFIHVEFNTSVVKDIENNIVAFAGMGRDMSKTYEADIERRRIFDVAQDLICIMTSNGFLKNINPAWEKILGWQNNEILSKSFFLFTHPDEKSETNNFIAQLIHGNKVNGFECRFRCKNGQYRTLVWDAEPYPDQNVVYAFARDITKERELRLQLLQKQKMEAIGTFAGGIAHDFNNILSSITGYAQLIKANPNDDAKENIEQVLLAAKRAKNLVNQILTFSRKQELSLEKIDLTLILKEVTRLVKASVAPGIEIITSYETNDMFVRGNFSQLYQLLLNLVTNGFQAIHSESGQVKISLLKISINGQQKSTIPVPHGQYVKMTIEDTGCGIPMYMIERIFDPFYSTKANGTGLGLSVVDGIVKNHGGHISVTSELNKGTLFEVYLPVMSDDTSTQDKIKTNDSEAKVKIVVVDDEKPVLDVISELLHDSDTTVYSFTKPGHALSFIQNNKVDLIITDLDMPEINGEKLAGMIKEHNKTIPVILMTGHSKQGDLDNPDLNDIIKKPFNIDDLIYQINKNIENRKGKRRN